MARTYSRRLARRADLKRACGAPLFGLLAGLALLTSAGLSSCTPVGVAAGVGATAGVVIAEERSVKDAAIDTRITVELAEALFQTHIDDLFRPVSIDVVEGRVMLSGMVKSQELADQAGEIAWKIDGVRQVYNELQIGDDSLVDPVRDRWITTKLRGRLLGDTKVFDVNYSITTMAGTIHLIGIAQDQAEIDRVVAHASDIKQVRRIVNHVVLKTDPSRQRAAEG
jgi:osmotically-inducible protein OsmY